MKNTGIIRRVDDLGRIVILAVQKNQCLDEEIRYVEMIANYLSVALEKK